MHLVSEISFSSKSMMDDFGRVFFLEGKVYRAIKNSSKDFCLTLINSPLFKELSNEKLIPVTLVSPLKLEGYELVLEHEALTETLQHEWSFSMLKAAAMAVFKVNTICNKHGFELKDAHAFNVLFRGTQPVFIDIGSIIPKFSSSSEVWTAYEEFLGAFIVPLTFWSEGMHFIARKLLESIYYGMTTLPGQSFINSGLPELLALSRLPYDLRLRSLKLLSSKREIKTLSLLSRKSSSLVRRLTGRNTQFLVYQRPGQDGSNLSVLFPFTKAGHMFDRLRSPASNSLWKGYHQKYYNEDGSTSYSARFLRIIELIKNTPGIRSIIDLAGNEGYFSALMDKELDLDKLIVADYDENAIDQAYQNFAQFSSEKVHTLLLNFMYTPDMDGTSKRLQSDLAIALAVTHHLVLTARYSLDAIFERLRAYSRQFVMVEFMPLGLWGTGDKIYPEVPQGYNLNWFRETFSIYYDIIVEEQLEENRILFFGRIKKGAKVTS